MIVSMKIEGKQASEKFSNYLEQIKKYSFGISVGDTVFDNYQKNYTVVSVCACPATNIVSVEVVSVI